MIKIIIDNVFTKVEGADKETELSIWSELSFQIEEYQAEHVRRRHLFNRKTKKTYTGLLPHVLKILDDIGEEYEIIDTRVKPEKNADFKLVDEIDIGDGKTVPLKFRPYQKDIVDGAEERECIQAATGAGKTFMMAALIAKYGVKPVKIFADKLTLCTQIQEEFEKFLGTEIGLVGGGQRDEKDITVYSIQSATPEDVKDAKLIMFDECLTGDTLVTLADGTQKTIQEIVENKLDCEVITYNTETKQFEPKSVYNWQKIPLDQKNKRMVKLTIELEDGSEEIIECTEDHKIWIESEGEYIEAGKLVPEMEVVCNK